MTMTPTPTTAQIPTKSVGGEQLARPIADDATMAITGAESPAQHRTAHGQGGSTTESSTGRTGPRFGYRIVRVADLRSDLHPLWHRGRRERWLPVVGLEGSYAVSDLGRVCSVDRIVTRSDGNTQHIAGPRIIRLATHRSGHLQVALYRNGKRSTRYVHRLVLEVFTGACPGGLEACHWNDEPTDNRLENLYWGTKRQNRLDRVRNSRRHNPRKSRCACCTCRARARERAADIARASTAYPSCEVCGNAVVAGQGTVHFSCLSVVGGRGQDGTKRSGVANGR
ncbi:NUMOD4 motif-containing HNH endonuclease [Mycolicibacterium setense]|uniref:NUMOD4 motif-containing HNH endonuclease n=1 Tax=Mycolicibacterium setense TaxID=431269 RepID=UPI0009E2A0EC|nr:NUMOD4 motif-containing HNH endonuclease [Mycolicibacterium setense]MCV7114009.1 HNH endonuclease [Mycolicibacterium setense]